jgi:hypothetical protein
MLGPRRLLTWWRMRRERAVNQLASRDPRTHIAREQTSQARRQREAADQMTADARARLREIDALRAAVKASRPQ